MQVVKDRNVFAQIRYGFVFNGFVDLLRCFQKQKEIIQYVNHGVATLKEAVQNSDATCQIFATKCVDVFFKVLE